MAKFISKYTDYQVLIRATYVEVKNGIPILNRGEKVVFENSEFATEDKKAIDILRKHPANGIDFIEVKEPEPEPEPEPERKPEPELEEGESEQIKRPGKEKKGK